MTSAWSVDRALSPHAQSLLAAFASRHSWLYVRGRGVEGSAGWLGLSVQAVDAALAPSPGLYVIQLVDTYPHPPSANESEWTRALAAEGEANAGLDAFEALFVAVRRTPFSVRPPPLSPAESDQQVGEATRIDALWRHVTAKVRGLVVVTLPCRAGPDRLWVNSALKANLSPEAHCGTGTALLIKDGEVVGALPLNETLDKMLQGLRAEVRSASKRAHE
jgi:hypothetical protein